MEERSSSSVSLNQVQATIAVFSSIIALTLSIIYSFTRLDLGDYSLLPVFKTLSFSFFLIFLPQFRTFVLQHFFSHLEKSWLATDASIILLGLIILTLSGSLVPVLGLNPWPLFSFLGFLLFITTHISYWKHNPIKQNIIFFIASILFSLWITGVAWGSDYQHPSYLEKIIIGNAHIDILFHVAIANMIKTYGIPSTGLDGFPYFSYHYGSHWLFAQISNLLNIHLLEFYQLGVQVIFLPFWFYSILSFTFSLKKYINIEGKINSLDSTFWMIFFVANIGFIPINTANKLALWDSYLLSESYLLSVSFFFIFLSITLSLISNKEEPLVERFIKRENLVFLLVILPLLLGLIGFFKISIMFLLFCLCLYLFIRKKLYKSRILNISMAIILTIFLTVYNLTKPATSGSSNEIELFHFIREFVPDLWRPVFFVLYLFWFWFFIILKCHQKNIKTLANLKDAYINNTIIDIEIVAFIGLVGMMPGIFLDLPSGAAYYFSDLQRWLSLSFLLANLESLLISFSQQA